MIKIAKVINDCGECEFCLLCKSTRDNYTKVYVCEHEKVGSFLLLKTIESGTPTIDIPGNCPLEDYKSTKK